MRNIRGSMCVKIVDWIGLFVSGGIFFGSVIGSFLIWRAGTYGQTEENMRRQIFEAVSDRYAVMAMERMKYAGNNKQFSLSDFLGTHYSYGIIKADELDGLDLNKDSTYVERNFTRKVTEEQLYTRFYQVNEDTSYAYTGGLLGEYGVSTPSYFVRALVENICYDIDGNIFYYETDSRYYPVQGITFELDSNQGTLGYDVRYNFDTKRYEDINVTQAAEPKANIEGIAEYIRYDPEDGCFYYYKTAFQRYLIQRIIFDPQGRLAPDFRYNFDTKKYENAGIMQSIGSDVAETDFVPDNHNIETSNETITETTNTDFVENITNNKIEYMNQSTAEKKSIAEKGEYYLGEDGFFIIACVCGAPDGTS